MPIQFGDQSYDFAELVSFLKEKHPDIANPDAYAAELDIQQNGSCMAKNYRMKMLVASKIEVLDEFRGKKGHFIRTFLINDTVNFNDWMTTKDANHRQSENWLGMPGVRFWSTELNRWDHPEYDTKEEALAGQEDYRVSTIVAVQWNADTKTWEQISEINDDNIWQQILSGEIKYVSPSAWPDEVVPGIDNPLVVTDYTPLHYAFVDDPAFGFVIATVSGTCDGTTKKCLAELGPLVASVRTTIQKTIPKISLIANGTNMNSLPAKTEHEIELENQIKQLKASLEETKTEVKTLKDEQTKETEVADTTKQTQVSGSVKIEDNEQFKQLKASNEKLEAMYKNQIIESMLTASKKAGATEEELKGQKEFMLTASIDQLQSFQKKFIDPLSKHFESFQITASNKDEDFPDITQISASTKDGDSETTDDDLLQAIGAMR